PFDPLFFRRAAAHLYLHSFPTLRSSDLGTAADVHHWRRLLMEKMPYQPELDAIAIQATTPVVSTDWQQRLPFLCGTRVVMRELRDRKSTRLNSSHRTISYAVFCLTKQIG